MLYKLKYNSASSRLIPLVFRLLCSNVKSFIFVASTGRSGTNTLQILFSAARNTYACHEDHPTMNSESMIRFNNNEPQLMRLEFNSRKLLRILFHSIGKQYYVETNHMFIKSFYPEALTVFGNRLKVIALERDPKDVALSIFRKNVIPGSEKGNKWWLDPGAPKNLLKFDEILSCNSKFYHDYFKCLWYSYEIMARIMMFKKNYPNIAVSDFQTKELNSIESFISLCNSLGIEYDKEKLSNIIGMRANSTPIGKYPELEFDSRLIDEFSKLCEAKIANIFNQL